MGRSVVGDAGAIAFPRPPRGRSADGGDQAGGSGVAFEAFPAADVAGPARSADPALAPTESALAQEGQPYKPQIEPVAPPLPPPVRPNAQGVIDLSADPSTAEFAKFLELGRARRQQEERAARAQSSTATPQ